MKSSIPFLFLFLASQMAVFGQTLDPKHPSRFSIGFGGGLTNTFLIGQHYLHYYNIGEIETTAEIPSLGFRLDFSMRAKLKGKHSLQAGLSYKQNKHWEKDEGCGFVGCYSEVFDRTITFLSVYTCHQYHILQGENIKAYFSNGLQMDTSLDYNWPESRFPFFGFSYLTKVSLEKRLGKRCFLSFSPIFSMALSRYSNKDSKTVDWPYSYGLMAEVFYAL